MQQPPMQQQPPGPPPQQPPQDDLSDGDWHRLHRLTPWLSFGTGGFIMLWVGLGLFVGLAGAIADGDLDLSYGTAFLLAAALFVVMLVVIAVSTYLDFRNRRFRLSDELFELRHGIIGTNHRQVRLDRLQSVNITRPFLARFAGLAQLETSGAGQDSDIKLSYLTKEQADRLRGEVLRRAAGARKRQGQGQTAGQAPNQPIGQAPGNPQAAVPGQASMPPRRRTLSDYIDAAVEDFSSAELPEGTVAEKELLRVPARRIAAATFLDGMVATIAVVVGLLITAIPVVIIVPILVEDATLPLLLLIVGLGILGMALMVGLSMGVAALVTWVSMMNYTIAGTPDGVRIGKGALTQTSDTVPPGRIHCVQIHQPLFWRPFGWYAVKVDRADLQQHTTSNSNEQAAQQQRQVVLPVGRWEDVQRVLSLVLPMHTSPGTAELLGAAMQPGAHPRFTGSPARARWLHPIQWRRLGYAIDGGLVCLRHGRFTRRVSLVPAERIQGVTLHDGPWRRGLGVVSLWINTVGNVVTTRLPNVDAQTSAQLFDALEGLAIERARLDTSHRWAEARARSMLATAHISAAQAAGQGQRLDAYTQRLLDAEAAWQRDGSPAG